MEATNSILREMTIDAEPATVFAFFTDPERLIRWVGVSAKLEPKPGGLLLIDVQNGFTARGEFREVVPVSR
ncbi:MAG: SRPBCC family protein, partial [Candidatus Binataceae bacterium]